MAIAVAPAPSEALTEALTKAEARHLTMLERRIATGLQTFREVGAALLEIRDSRLYRETHSTFELYCTEKWGMPRARAYHLIDSAKVVAVLGDPSDLTNEAQARELADIESPSEMKTVWAAVEKTKQPITAALIRQVRGEVLTPTSVQHADTPTDRLVASIGRLMTQYAAWKSGKPNIGERNRVKVAVKALTEALT